MMTDEPTDFGALLDRLTAAGVEFILIGGVAGIVLGAPRATFDLDVLYRRSPENLDRLVTAIGPLDPYPRGAPQGLPFAWDRRALEFGLNFTLRTSFGFVDLLGEIAGGTYDTLVPNSEPVTAFGVRCLCLNLPTLIRTKRAAGRPKDFEAIAELELMRDRQRQPAGGITPPGGGASRDRSDT